MVCVNVCGVAVRVDFTAPALLALMFLTLPQTDAALLVLACVLHESAHFLALSICREKPTELQISGLGMQLCIPQAVVLPLGKLAVIALAGAAANGIAAVCFAAHGMDTAAAVNVSMGMFNLLPFRGTDGGTLLYAFYEQIFAERGVDVKRVWKVQTAAVTILLGMLLFVGQIWNISLWGMLIYLAAQDITA